MADSIDISILFDKPEPTQKAALLIEPLAPLSLVTAMPGAYYRSEKEPSKFMIYGMLENLLGWHFSEYERKNIIDEMKNHYGKVYRKDRGLRKLQFEETNVKFKPLLQHHLIIQNLLLKPSIKSFEDYWTQHLKDVDSRHIKGVRNYDYRLNEEIQRIKEIKVEKEQNLQYDKLMKAKIELIPIYYQSPTKREYINVIGKYGYQILTTEKTLNALIESVNILENPIYLGANEGWVQINIEKL